MSPLVLYARLKMTPQERGRGDVIAARRQEVRSWPVQLGVPSFCLRRFRDLFSLPILSVMDDAHESPSDKGGETGESDETAAAPGDPGATDTDGIPEETDGDADADLKEAAAEEGELKSQDVSDLTTVEREDSSLLTPAAKKLKIDTKEKKEKKQKVDEDEIQKMQCSSSLCQHVILVSSFSEEQLNRYEMYRRSAFPKAAIKRHWMCVRSGEKCRHYNPNI
ncbi:transcription initiation factor TFIID subunit 11 isoform X3 [Symphalangus syndactylus]|uniref:transcription initiation factor TFIID subunit 11 isoform X3 n=1 Tax=Symphalangus syndactylus TaxID=9590 RepID=UPI003007D00D